MLSLGQRNSLCSNIEEYIKSLHTDDKKQLEVIFSNEKRILVEAPAGCGKTRTMTSKILYIICKNQLPNPKKLLGLTFSVNAAYKMRKEIRDKLPNDFKKLIGNRLFITNYHGFCRQVLKRYGFLIDKNLLRIDHLIGINENYEQKLVKEFKLNFKEASILSSMAKYINQANYNVYENMNLKKIFRYMY